MSAPEREPRDAMRDEFLRLCESVPANKQPAFLKCLSRIAGRLAKGETIEECYIEIIDMLIELGDTPCVARKKARETFGGSPA